MTRERRAEHSCEQEHDQTTRQALREALRDGPKTARELAMTLSIREREVIEHLEHVRLSSRDEEHFVVVPATCRKCGAVFENRERLTRPGRCPRCKSERIVAPKFALE